MPNRHLQNPSGEFAPVHSLTNRPAKRFHDPALSNRAFAIFFIVTILIAAALLLAPKARAANATWTGLGADSRWSTTGNWNATPVPASGNTATFSGAGNGKTTIDLTGGVTINTILFDTSPAAAYTIGSGGVNNQTLTLNFSGAITVNSTVTNNQLINSTLTLGTNGTSTGSFSFTNDSTSALLTIAGNVSQATSNSNNPARTLNLAGSGNGVISGIINGNGNSSGSNAQPLVSLAKSGTGTWTLSGADTYAGTTTINGGTLKIDNNNTTSARLSGTSGITVNSGGTLLLAQTGLASTDRIDSGATITLNGGTFNTAGLSEGATGTVGIGALTLQDNSIINLGAGASVLHFAASNSATWTPSVVLQIQNWTGNAAGGGTDQILFGTTSSGLNTGQLAEIQFINPAGFTPGNYLAKILSNGEIVPVPEPSTWIGGALALAAVGFTQRRRFARLLNRAA